MAAKKISEGEGYAMEDSAPFRFNFAVGVSQKGGDAGGGGQNGDEARGVRKQDAMEVEAQAATVAKEIRPAQEDLARSQGSIVYAEHKLESSTALWKVVKLDQSTLVQGLEESTDLVPGRYEGMLT